MHYTAHAYRRAYVLGETRYDMYVQHPNILRYFKLGVVFSQVPRIVMIKWLKQQKQVLSIRRIYVQCICVETCLY